MILKNGIRIKVINGELWMPVKDVRLFIEDYALWIEEEADKQGVLDTNHVQSGLNLLRACGADFANSLRKEQTMGLFRSREKQLQRAISQLEDAAWEHEKWGFANSPSEDRRDLDKIRKLAAKVQELGGDPWKYVSTRYSA